MKHTLILLFLTVVTFGAGMMIGSAFTQKARADDSKPVPVVATTTPQALLDHQQLVWEYALEYCESSGVEDAVNAKDVDGTPSYYSYQFKPSTFAWLEQKYGITGPISSWAAQHAIVEHMILDKSITDYQWRHEYFPGCTKKLGTPPQST